MINAVRTAAMLVIGDEILSGKTKDKNIGVLAEALTLAGIDLVEVRIVADDMPAIVGALNELRAMHSYVFTSGGIGPTHDDITAESVAHAFGVDLEINADAHHRLSTFYEKTGRVMNPARERMTRMPVGVSLIDNPVSVAPGFRKDNVFILAGVPSVFEAMIGAVLPTLEGSVPIDVRTVPFACGEGDIATQLSDLADAYPTVSIGSYPKLSNGQFTTEIVLRSRDVEALDKATRATQSLQAEMASTAETL